MEYRVLGLRRRFGRYIARAVGWDPNQVVVERSIAGTDNCWLYIAVNDPLSDTALYARFEDSRIKHTLAKAFQSLLQLWNEPKVIVSRLQVSRTGSIDDNVIFEMAMLRRYSGVTLQTSAVTAVMTPVSEEKASQVKKQVTASGKI